MGRAACAASHRLLQPHGCADAAARPALRLQIECAKGTWDQAAASRLKFATKSYDNRPLREGLLQLGLRQRQEGDADAGVVHREEADGSEYVFTALGRSLWHDSMQAALASFEAARGLPLFWSLTEPAAGQQAAGQQAAWLGNRLVIAA